MDMQCKSILESNSFQFLFDLFSLFIQPTRMLYMYVHFHCWKIVKHIIVMLCKERRKKDAIHQQKHQII